MISIIIPTLNEAGKIAGTLHSICGQTTEHEILVVDAGSEDATVALARQSGARLVHSPQRQRARQMNLGAGEAVGEVLLFLHADTRLPENGLARIQQVMAGEGKGAVVGGGFARRFDCGSRWLRATCALATLRGRSLGWFLGDQAIFVRTSVFKDLAGYREMGLFEDLDFSRRLARTGRVVTLRPGVVSSARRFERRGAVLTTLRDFWLIVQYLAGGK